MPPRLTRARVHLRASACNCASQPRPQRPRGLPPPSRLHPAPSSCKRPRSRYAGRRSRTPPPGAWLARADGLQPRGPGRTERARRPGFAPVLCATRGLVPSRDPPAGGRPVKGRTAVASPLSLSSHVSIFGTDVRLTRGSGAGQEGGDRAPASPCFSAVNGLYVFGAPAPSQGRRWPVRAARARLPRTSRACPGLARRPRALPPARAPWSVADAGRGRARKAGAFSAHPHAPCLLRCG